MVNGKIYTVNVNACKEDTICDYFSLPGLDSRKMHA